MDNNSVALAAISLSGVIVAGMFKQLSSNTKAQNRNSKAMENLVKETKRGNNASEERNGHLGNLIIKTSEGIKDSLEKPVNVQTVETQVVKEQK